MSKKTKYEPTLVCSKCGATLIGDSPAVVTICEICKKKYEPFLAEGESELVNAVLKEIQRAVEIDDLEAVDELLRFCPRINLIQYLPEDEWHKYMTEEERQQIYGKYRVGNFVIVDGKAGMVNEKEYENGEWTYRVSFDELNFGWFGENEMRKSTNEDADMDAQDPKWGKHKV